MKTILLSLLTATLLGLAGSTSGRLFEAADFIAIAFATGLVAWTFYQYHSAAQNLDKAHPIHSPIKTGDRPAVLKSVQHTA